jgi:hypothetical protein
MGAPGVSNRDAIAGLRQGGLH